MKTVKRKRPALKQKRMSVSAASALLLESESEIISLWEDRARKEIPAADEHSSKILKNSLPSFIIGLATVLAENGGADACTKVACEEHGEQRAEKTYYSAEQVVHEYRLLRESIFQVLEKTGALDARTRDLINIGVDHGIAQAVTGFVRRLGRDQEQIERKLFESEERFSLALRAGKIGVWEMNLKTPKIQCTSRQFRIFDIDPVEGEISFDLFQERLHPEDRRLMVEEIASSVKSQRDFVLEHRVIWRDGSVHWVRENGRPYFDEAGNPDRMLGTSIDITESRLEQNHRHELIDSLQREQDIRERFVNALTHDLRTPLTAAKMSGQLVARMASNPDDVVRLATRVVDNLNRADEMISDLLDAGRIRAGLPLALQLKECELRPLLQATLDELTIIHGNRFILEGEGDVTGFWDAKGIRRIIENLCTNAVRYGDSHAPILLRFKENERGVEISVENRGEGLSVEEQHTLFNLFERSKSAKSLGGKGWGIGLTVVKGIAESHRGSVAVRSEMGEITFTVRLPVDARPFLATS